MKSTTILTLVGLMLFIGCLAIILVTANTGLVPSPIGSKTNITTKNNTNFIKITAPEIPEDVNAIEQMYFSDKFVKQNDIIVYSKYNLNGVWNPDNSPNSNIKSVDVEIKTINLRTGINYSLIGSFDIPKYYKGNFDIDSTSKEILVFKDGLTPRITWKYSTSNSYSEKVLSTERITFYDKSRSSKPFTNITKLVVPVKVFNTYRNIELTSEEGIRLISDMFGHGILLDPALSDCGTISSSGTYTLNQSIGSGGDCLIINASDVVIDGQGLYTINGNVDGSSVGGYVDEYETTFGNPGHSFTLTGVNLTGTITSNGAYIGDFNNGNGGGITITGSSTVTGTITSNGGGDEGGGNGGAGGTITITGSSIVTGTITSNGADGNNAGNGGAVTITDSTAGIIVANTGGYNGGRGAITITNSTTGALTCQGANSEGTITITNSTTGDVDASNIGNYGQNGGNIIVTDSTTGVLTSNGGIENGGNTGGTGGTITITNSTVGGITTNGGYASTTGGTGGTITLANSTTGTITSNGGSSAIGGTGGTITVISSDVSNVIANGGDANGEGYSSGNGGTINITNPSTWGTLNVAPGTATEGATTGSWGHIYIDGVDATNDIYSCMTITSAGTYTLKNNITADGTCLTISADDVVIDGRGFKITGNLDGSGVGVNGLGDGNGGHNFNLTAINVNGTISANGIVGNYERDGGRGGIVIITNSTMKTISANGGGFGGDGGNITIINSTATTISTNGGNYSGGGFDGNGGAITIINSNVTAVSSYGANSWDNYGAGRGGIITIINSIAGAISVSGGNGVLVAGHSGTVTIANSTTGTITADGGSAGYEAGTGGTGGAVTIANSTTQSITTNGGSYNPNGGWGTGGNAGTITMTANSIVDGIVTSNGGNSSIDYVGGNGGNITFTNGCIAPLDKPSLVSVTGGLGGVANGTNGLISPNNWDTCRIHEDPAYWLNYTKNLMNFWYKYSYNPNNGAMYTDISANGTKTTDRAYGRMIGRQMYGFSAGYNITGNVTYLATCDSIYSFLNANFWDNTYGGWLGDYVNGTSGNRATPSTVKSGFDNDWMNAGLASCYWVTGNETYLNQLITAHNLHYQTRNNQTNTYPANMNNSWYVIDNSTGLGNMLDNLIGETLPLYTLTNNETYLNRTRDSIDAINNYLINSTYGVEVGTNKIVSIGHNVKFAWVELMYYNLTGNITYFNKARDVFDKSSAMGYGDTNGAWFDFYNITSGTNTNVINWWTQEEGIVASYLLYKYTGNTTYYNIFNKSANFFANTFIDPVYGEVYDKANGTGYVTNTRKGYDYKSAYHTSELGLFMTNFINGDLRYPIRKDYSSGNITNQTNETIVHGSGIVSTEQLNNNTEICNALKERYVLNTKPLGTKLTNNDFDQLAFRLKIAKAELINFADHYELNCKTTIPNWWLIKFKLYWWLLLILLAIYYFTRKNRR